MEHGISGAGFGREGKPCFWLQSGAVSGPIHLAFARVDRATVDAFYRAAIAAGALDNGGPGLRPNTIQTIMALLSLTLMAIILKQSVIPVTE